MKENMSENPLSKMEPWDLVSAGYVKELLPVFSKWAQDSFARVQPQPEDRVIDVACGPGTVSLLLAPLVKNIVALDFSANMIAELKKALDEKEIHNVIFRQRDCQSLDENDLQFDLAFSQFGLMFFPDLDAGLTELFRVLKPGGKAAIYSWAPISESPAMRLVMNAIWVGFPHLKPCDEDMQGLIKGLDDRGTFVAKLTSAGFEQVSIEPIAHSFKIESALDFWHALVSSSAPICWLKKELSDEDWLVGEGRAIAYLEEKINEPMELASMALLGIGVRPKG